MRKSISSSYFGNISLASCPKITMRMLQDSLKHEEHRLLQEMYPEIAIVGHPCNYGGVRYYFQCPLCHRKVATLYEDPHTTLRSCQKCTGYAYPKQRYKGMIEEKTF